MKEYYGVSSKILDYKVSSFIRFGLPMHCFHKLQEAAWIPLCLKCCLIADGREMGRGFIQKLDIVLLGAISDIVF